MPATSPTWTSFTPSRAAQAPAWAIRFGLSAPTTTVAPGDAIASFSPRICSRVAPSSSRWSSPTLVSTASSGSSTRVASSLPPIPASKIAISTRARPKMSSAASVSRSKKRRSGLAPRISAATRSTRASVEINSSVVDRDAVDPHPLGPTGDVRGGVQTDTRAARGEQPCQERRSARLAVGADDDHVVARPSGRELPEQRAHGLQVGARDATVVLADDRADRRGGRVVPCGWLAGELQSGPIVAYTSGMGATDSDFERLLNVGHGDLNAAVMVTSLDGIVAVEGHVGGLTAAADQRLLLGMRERARAVVVGAATVRAEGYGGLLPAPARQRRAGAGLAPQPELVVLSRSADGVAGTEAAGAADLELRVERPPTNRDGAPDLRVVSAGIRERHGPGLTVWEGGPTIVRTALAQGVLDELFFAISPMLAGRGLPLAGPETSGTSRLRLIGTAVSEDFVFLRYGLRDGA